MSEAGVIPPPEERRRPRFTETGSFVTSAGNVLTFGTEGTRVILLADGADIVLALSEQDTFARLLFRAMNATEVIDAAEVPF